MSDAPPKPPGETPPPRTRPDVPAGPPRLERVPDGYRPPAVPRAAAPAARPPPPPPPAPTYGLAAREVGADAAIAAGLAHQGALAADSALRLYGLAAATRASGRLTLAPEGRSYALVFRRGAVEHAASSDPADDLGRFLLRKGVLRPEQLVEAEAARAAAGGDLAAALVGARLVPPGDVAALLAEHGLALVARALAVEDGTWAWEPGVGPPPSGFPLGPPFAALCAAVRALELPAVKRRLGDREERAASRMAGRVRIEDLRLTPQEARAAALVDGERSPAEIAAASPADAAAVLRLSLLLGELDLLAFGAPRRARAPAPGVAPPPARAATPTPTPRPTPTPVPPPAAAPAAAAPRPPPPRPPPVAAAPAPRTTPAPAAVRRATALEPAALRATLASLQDADHFQVLGVKRDAPAAQVKVAYFQLAKLYHPDAIPTDAPADVRKLCADLFGRVSAAWAELGDEARRAQYLQELQSGGAPEVDVMGILQAENLFQTGTQLVKARRYDEALAKFLEALQLNPEEPEFGIWKAWCEFLRADDKKRQQAQSAAAVEAGLKKNPRCAPGYLFLGQMAKVLGDLALAERHLRRGLAAAPDNADLARELKYLRK
ncbi:J domain-containing protein [Anaeromyxobacter dehalogenans]|uniref:DnaJ like heat shock protein with tetratricopeptide repeats n=1 Tax=Anaeromyxobacter dehalogenans (strain 2CP-C) TaxID=290397 RepID=Q2IMK5_ANADE|nr:DnaJ domain-containing protein [Anaeromyxobacter dehalogenans]ABC80036.1 DnaJ like heat shock protein with tetratricopeptide repeats [Anaeromyxobacter dehalogenans 2CP-C]